MLITNVRSKLEVRLDVNVRLVTNEWLVVNLRLGLLQMLY